MSIKKTVTYVLWILCIGLGFILSPSPLGQGLESPPPIPSSDQFYGVPSFYSSDWRTDFTWGLDESFKISSTASARTPSMGRNQRAKLWISIPNRISPATGKHYAHLVGFWYYQYTSGDSSYSFDVNFYPWVDLNRTSWSHVWCMIPPIASTNDIVLGWSMYKGSNFIPSRAWVDAVQVIELDENTTVGSGANDSFVIGKTGTNQFKVMWDKNLYSNYYLQFSTNWLDKNSWKLATNVQTVVGNSNIITGNISTNSPPFYYRLRL